jgi:prepilin-type processing-associated H-X9-DG protein
VVPISYGNPNVSQSSFTTNYECPRVNAFGSLHSGGANFAMIDGSVRFLKQTVAPTVYHTLGTRASGEVISADSY